MVDTFVCHSLSYNLGLNRCNVEKELLTNHMFSVLITSAELYGGGNQGREGKPHSLSAQIEMSPCDLQQL